MLFPGFLAALVLSRRRMNSLRSATVRFLTSRRGCATLPTMSSSQTLEPSPPAPSRAPPPLPAPQPRWSALASSLARRTGWGWLGVPALALLAYGPTLGIGFLADDFI